jgi:hypothetical protein
MVGLFLIANTISIRAALGAIPASARLSIPAAPFAPLVIAIVIVLVEVYRSGGDLLTTPALGPV